MSYIDMHIHSTHSDGTLTPTEIVAFARQNKLRAIALTDHDTVTGVTEAIAAGERNGLEVVPGIEFSSIYHERDVHILGYFIDIQDPGIIEYTRAIRKYRQDRAVMIIDLLKKSGININMQLVLAKSNGGVIGRPHIADVMIDEGHVFSFRDAFDKYLGETGAAYVPKRMITPLQAIDIIHQAGGLAYIAHPGVNISEEILLDLVKHGLDGVEVYHPKHTSQETQYYMEFCHQYHLFITGGSDSHGTRISDITIGSMQVPYSHLVNMKNACKV